MKCKHFQDSHLSKEEKQERLERMIRNELIGNNSDRQTPAQSLPAETSGTEATYYQSQTSLRHTTSANQHSRPSSRMKFSQ